MFFFCIWVKPTPVLSIAIAAAHPSATLSGSPAGSIILKLEYIVVFHVRDTTQA